MDYYPRCIQCTKEGYNECVCTFCTMCGEIGHRKRSCRVQRDTSVQWSQDELHFASWPQYSASSIPGYGRYISESEWLVEVSNSGHDAQKSDKDTNANNKAQDLIMGHIVQNSTKRTTTMDADLTNFRSFFEETGRVDCKTILRDLLVQVESKHGSRYAEPLASSTLINSLDSCLVPGVKVSCENGDFSVSNLIGLGGSPELSKDTGIYLHILRSRRTNRFWLYVGQAITLRERIQNHNNPLRRKSQRTLHNTIWDSEPEMESVFVTLAIRNMSVSKEEQLLLNLLEMWMCLVFQTLRGVHLDEYLPAAARKLWAGCHLNVALPLWQSFNSVPNAEVMGGRTAFQEYLIHEDPEVRQWAKEHRDAFNDIRNSPDPALREYYKNLQDKRHTKANETSQTKKSQKMLKFIEGGLVKISESHGGEFNEIHLGTFRFTVSRKLKTKFTHGQEVVLRFELSQNPHPHACTMKARPDDPASRLGVSIGNKIKDEDYFQEWLTTSGDRAVMKMNSLVDILDGYSLEETRSFRRRFYEAKEKTPDGIVVTKRKYTSSHCN